MSGWRCRFSGRQSTTGRLYWKTSDLPMSGLTRTAGLYCPGPTGLDGVKDWSASSSYDFPGY